MLKQLRMYIQISLNVNNVNSKALDSKWNTNPS